MRHNLSYGCHPKSSNAEVAAKNWGSRGYQPVNAGRGSDFRLLAETNCEFPFDFTRIVSRSRRAVAFSEGGYDAGLATIEMKEAETNVREWS